MYVLYVVLVHRGVASFLDCLGTRSGCPHANYLARNVNPSLWTLYYIFAFGKLLKSAYST